MKKLLLTLVCVFTMAIVTAQSTTPTVFTWFVKRDMNKEKVSDHITYAELVYNDKQQFVFTEGKDTLTFNVLSTEPLTTSDGLTTKFYKIQDVDTSGIMWLQIFDDAKYGIRFIIIGQGTYTYLPY
jgi:hypothetical protein